MAVTPEEGSTLMSLTDPDRPTVQPAPADVDLAGPQTPPRPRWLVAVIAGLIVVSLVCFGIAGCTALQHKATTPATTPPAIGTNAPTTPLSPSPTPTDPRDQAAQAALDAYKAKVAAYFRAANAGGGDTIPAYLAALVDGPAAKATLADLKLDKANGLAGSGKTIPYARIDYLGDDVSAKATPTATLATCLDQTQLNVTKNGKPYAGKPNYIRESVTMRRTAGRWKVYDYTDELWTNGDCTNAIGTT